MYNRSCYGEPLNDLILSFRFVILISCNWYVEIIVVGDDLVILTFTGDNEFV
jgi:hypothetical protein